MHNFDFVGAYFSNFISYNFSAPKMNIVRTIPGRHNSNNKHVLFYCTRSVYAITARIMYYNIVLDGSLRINRTLIESAHVQSQSSETSGCNPRCSENMTDRRFSAYGKLHAIFLRAHCSGLPKPSEIALLFT